ncbi:MAG TPA: helix-turn-helix domain-containing protein [Sedimentisphaerales bacterium]|nr:helix-turn-helix domain-containing protein [Sedimentisphaerales bacterium]
MASKSITKRISKSVFTRVQAAFFKHFGMALETTDARGAEETGLCSSGCHPEFCKLVRSAVAGRCMQDRIRSMGMAIDTGQPYISFCHAGIAIVCVPIMDGDTPLGGLFFGKCLFNEAGDAIIADINECLKDADIDPASLNDAIDELPVIPGRRIHQAAEFLYILFYEISGLDPCVVRFRRRKTQQQSQISEFMQENKLRGYDKRYPVESEKELVGKVRIGDRIGAREILNSIIGTLLLQYPGEMNVLKARMIELLSVISRAAVEGGVAIDELLPNNLEYLQKMLRITSQDELGAWISAAMEEFTELVCNSRDARKASQITPAIQYIDVNYNRAISLSEIAKAAHLSPSRLAHVFKEHTGQTVVDYVTQVRIGHARELLLATTRSCMDICFAVGYSNQSYFTRTFREQTGMTPRQFRQNNARAPRAM